MNKQNQIYCLLEFSPCFGTIQGNTIPDLPKILENFQVNACSLSKMIFRKISAEKQTEDWIKISNSYFPQPTSCNHTREKKKIVIAQGRFV